MRPFTRSLFLNCYNLKFMFHFISIPIIFRAMCGWRTVYSVQAMTRTPPVYTVRWSSQISPRLNNRGPPTPVPNAVSSASSMSILNFKHIHSNLYQNDNNHCFSTRITNNHNTYSNNNNNNYFSSNDSDVMNIVNCNQYKSLTNRLDDAVIDTTNAHHTMSVFALIVNNKFGCLFIALWMYKFLAVEIQ